MHYYHELLLNAYAYSNSKPSYLFILIIAVYDYLVSHFGSDQDDQRKPDLLSYLRLANGEIALLLFTSVLKLSQLR